jgi:hypothetical protein
MRKFVYLPMFLLLLTTACQKSGSAPATTTDNPQTAIDYYNRGVERQGKGDINAALAITTKPSNSTRAISTPSTIAATLDKTKAI